MGAIVAVTGPIFALVAVGYLVTWLRLFQPTDLRALGRYVVTLALPALIFRAVTAHDLGALFDPGYLAAYLGGSLAVLALGTLLGRRAGLDSAASIFQGMGMSCANTGFVGYPILLMAIPAMADRALALNMIAENLVIIPLILLFAERGRGGGGPFGTIRRVVANPIVLSLLAGLAVALSGLALPGVVVQAVELVARSSAAVSLVVIGGTLVGVARAGRGRRVAAVVAGKLVLHPLAVAAGFALLALAGVRVDPAMAAAGVLIAATPAMGIYPILAAQYGQGATAAVAMLAMTLGAFFTLGGLLWALGLV
jgi:malonate transporter and related proteins